MNAPAVTPLGVALRSLLLASPQLVALVGDRVHPHSVMRGLPAITYQRIGGIDAQEHDGLTGFEDAEVQVDVWAATDAQAEEVGVLAKWQLVGAAPGYRIDALAIDSAVVTRDRGVTMDAADRTDDAPVWRYSFDVSISFTRLQAA